MLHNTRKRFRFYNTREKLSSRRQTSFQIKEKKEEEIRESNLFICTLMMKN